MNKLFFLLPVFIAGGCNSDHSKSKVNTGNLDMGAIAVKFSGKKFLPCEGAFDRKKIIALIVDRHNWVWEDSTINAELKKNNLLAIDSGELKTIAMIYNPKLKSALFDDSARNEPTYRICFVDSDSMCIRRLIDCKFNLEDKEVNSLLANQIVNELLVK